MGTILTVVIIGILVALIAVIVIFIVKNIATPSKLDAIPKMIREGKIQAAQKTAKAVISKDPRNYMAHYYLGKAYLADNKQELAFMEYKTVNQNAIFNGDIPEAEFRNEMANLYTRFNQVDEALKEYLLLTKLEPHNAEHDFHAGEIYEKKNNNALAMGFYQKALTKNKKHAKAHTAMGHLLFRAKNYNEAKRVIDIAIKLNPEVYENYYYLGKIYKETKELSTAVKYFEKAQRSPELRQKALIERGTCLMLAGQIDQAAGELDRAVKNAKDPKSQDTLYARYFLGTCYEKNRQIERAIEQWEEVFKINSKFKDVSAKLAQYKELETNDGIKEYLTASNTDFMELSKKIASAFGLACQKIEPTKFGSQLLCTEEKSGTWMNVRQQVFYLQLYRTTEPVEDTVVRKVADIVKDQGYVKGIIITSSEFSRTAVSFAEGRPIQLVAKANLEAAFKKIGM